MRVSSWFAPFRPVDATHDARGGTNGGKAAGMKNVPTITVIVMICALALGACSSSSSKSSPPAASSSPAVSSSPTSAAVTTTTLASGPHSIGHVFVINLENEDYDSTWGPASPAHYLNQTLVPKGKLLTQYFGIAHASLGNYVAEISGQAPTQATQADCVHYTDFAATGTGAYGQALGSGCVYPRSVETIAGQLTATGKTWRGYMEDMGTPCRHPAIGTDDTTIDPKPDDMYATRHDPFVYFHSILDTPACVQNVVDYSKFAGDLKSIATTPNLAFITPDVCHDGHDSPCVDGEPGGLVSADQFLAREVPKILASPAYKADGLLVITLDEAQGNDASACCHTPPAPNVIAPGLLGPGGGRVGTLLVSSRVRPGTTDATPYNHYALLCSLEDIFGLKHLGFAGAPGLACFGKDVYDAP
jgi:hypothetical protein